MWRLLLADAFANGVSYRPSNAIANTAADAITNATPHALADPHPETGAFSRR